MPTIKTESRWYILVKKIVRKVKQCWNITRLSIFLNVLGNRLHRFTNEFFQLFNQIVSRRTINTGKQKYSQSYRTTNQKKKIIIWTRAYKFIYYLFPFLAYKNWKMKERESVCVREILKFEKHKQTLTDEEIMTIYLQCWNYKIRWVLP